MSEKDPSVTKLPEQSEITRRDFVGGTLVGTGATLLAMASPGAVRTAQAQTVPDGERIFVGRDQIRPLYQEVVKDNKVKIDSVYTFVNGNAGWDWADFNVTPTDGKTKPFTFAILFLWAKIDGVWMCKGDFFVRGRFRSGKLAPPEAPARR